MAMIAPEINATLDTVGFVLGPDDQLEVQIVDNPEWTHVVVVQPDGLASFLGLDPMPAAGLQPGQLQERLEQDYAGVLGKKVVVSVRLSELAPRHVTVLGEVTEPGEIPLQLGQRMTLLQAFAGAGGFSKDTAWLGSVVVIRWDAAESRQLSWTVDARPQTWTGGTSILLQPFDVVYVPNTPIDNVNIFIDKYIRQNLPFPQLVTVQ